MTTYGAPVTDPALIAQLESSSQDITQNQQQPSSLVDKFNSAIEGSGLPSLAGGLLQGAADTGISIANVIPELLGSKKISHPDFSKYLPQDTLSRAAFTGGNIAGSSVLPIGLYSKASSALPMLENLTGKNRLLSDVLKGSASGYLTGEQAPGGREGGALLGGVLSSANAFKPSSIANVLMKDKNKVEGQYRSDYRNLFDTANENGMGKVSKPPINFNYLDKNVPDKYTSTLKDFLSNPTTENAHWAQSDLGKYMRDIGNNPNLTSSQIKSLKIANDTQKRLNNSISDVLSKKPDLNLNDTYNNLSQGYLNDVVPYKNSAFSLLKKGDISNNGLVNRLSGNEKFMNKMGGKYPEMQIRNSLSNPLAKYLLGGTGIGLALSPAVYYGLNK